MMVGADPDSVSPGCSHQEEFVAAYCSKRGIAPLPTHTWNFYIALSLFRMAAIVAGIEPPGPL
eukprot:scaffold440324_cov41-Prasinocladus_malaysianus.AAC.1